MSNLSEAPAESAGDNIGGIQPGRYYGRGIPYLPIGDYPGKLIAIEGTDGVGRSTQMQLLREWLEVKGYGVVETGWTRSPLMQPTIELAKSSNTLNKLTFVLLYATDFADRLEKEVIPALKAGFVVLSDEALFSYKCTERYHPETERSIRWDDPDIGIEWPTRDVSLSAKDQAALRLRDIDPALLPTHA